MPFSTQQIEQLAAPLNRSHVKQRTQAGRSLSYVESWQAIAEANRIFGFDAWASETLDVRCVAEAERKIGRAPNQRDGWSVSYVAKVRVTVGDVVREGTGAGHGIDADLGLAHESAIKEAESDARKRALMTFGNPFGLALYDKAQREVVDEPTPKDRFLAATHATIDSFGGSRADLVTWWNDPAQKTQRRDFGLTIEEVEALKAKVAAYQEPRQEAAE